VVRPALTVWPGDGIAGHECGGRRPKRCQPRSTAARSSSQTWDGRGNWVVEARFGDQCPQSVPCLASQAAIVKLQEDGPEGRAMGAQSLTRWTSQVGHQMGDLVDEHAGEAGARCVTPDVQPAMMAHFASRGVGGGWCLELVDDHAGAELDDVGTERARRVGRAVVGGPYALSHANPHAHPGDLRKPSQ
jgi:hypothetical protein